MKKTTEATARVADDPTPHIANKTISTPPIKINWKATPYALIEFSKLKKNCSHRTGNLCLEDPDGPQDCEIGLCPILEMPISRRAAFQELMENDR